MDDHGDDFTAWLGRQDQAAQRAEEQWNLIAQYIRRSGQQGRPRPAAVPARRTPAVRARRPDPRVAWAAALKAAAHHLIETSAPNPAHAAYYAGPLYQRQLAHLRGNGTQPGT